jgi:plastocyanin
VVHIKNFGYQPDTVTVRVGGTVTWINDDNVDHTTTAKSGAWDSGTLAHGQRFVHRFAKAGTYPYYCSFHAFMTGTVRVVG